ncbi:MAG: hypothetical protein IJS54_02570 [Desulfovibrio sp.]|nr:hypothetical protein [Desulfovibrio sp.]
MRSGIVLSLLACLVWGNVSFAGVIAQEGSIGEWHSLAADEERLATIKKIRKLELDILELEAKARAYTSQGKQRPVAGEGSSSPALPVVCAIATNAVGGLDAQLQWPSGSRQWVRVHERFSFGTITSISRKGVVAKHHGQRITLDYVP